MDIIFSGDLKRALQIYSKLSGRTKASIVREAVALYLDGRVELGDDRFGLEYEYKDILRAMADMDPIDRHVVSVAYDAGIVRHLPGRVKPAVVPTLPARLRPGGVRRPVGTPAPRGATAADVAERWKAWAVEV